MDLESRLDKRLWSTVESAYQNRHYTTAILDAIHFLNQLIRDKSGLESDGHALAGEAFGGANPKLKVNSFQTDSEKNIQKGVEALLRGLAQAIRNPRSHGLHSDTLQDAETLILFIDLVRIIDQSKSPFDRDAFLDRVCDDPYFPVDNERYVELLIEEIPVGKRLDILIDAFRRRNDSNVEKLQCFAKALLQVLSAEELDQFCSVVSDDLKTVMNDTDIRLTIRMMPAEYWPKYAETARLRIENKLIESARSGRYVVGAKRCQEGNFGTWIRSLAPHMVMKRKLGLVLTAKIDSKDVPEQDYVFSYLFNALFAVESEPNKRLVSAILDGLKNGDKRFYNQLYLRHAVFKSLPTSWEDNFGNAIDNFREATPTPRADTIAQDGITDDDVPF